MTRMSGGRTASPKGDAVPADRWPTEVRINNQVVIKTWLSPEHYATARDVLNESVSPGGAFLVAISQRPEGCDTVNTAGDLNGSGLRRVIRTVDRLAATEEELEAELDGAM